MGSKDDLIFGNTFSKILALGFKLNLLKIKLLSLRLSANPSAELFNSLLLYLNASFTDFKIDIQFFLGK